jgi:hypothetical protein
MAEGRAHDQKSRLGTDVDHTERGQRKRPFDTSGVSWFPEHDDDDPPYRDWWVVNQEEDDE